MYIKISSINYEIKELIFDILYNVLINYILL